jgi:hypothetical protein
VVFIFTDVGVHDQGSLETAELRHTHFLSCSAVYFNLMIYNLVYTVGTVSSNKTTYHSTNINIFEEDCSWDISPYSLVGNGRRFRGAYYVPHHYDYREAFKSLSVSARIHGSVSEKRVISILASKGT